MNGKAVIIEIVFSQRLPLVPLQRRGSVQRQRHSCSGARGGLPRTSALSRRIRARKPHMILELTCCSATPARQPTFG
jgi:hypothetical protein